MRTIDALKRQPFSGDFFRGLIRLAGHANAWLAWRLQRRRSRLDLLELTDHQLKDLGLSRCDAHREGIRPFWD